MTLSAKSRTQIEFLIDAYWAGDMGDVEFTEVAFDAGMSLDEINQVLNDVREEDGIL